MFNTLDEAKEACKNCTKCKLSATRTNTVFGEGVVNNKIILIGEAPGFYEDKAGRPFVGKAGMLLDKILGCAGFSREKNIYICNTIKCRPPENRDPEADEKEACREFLDTQINIMKPKIILICGRVALESMFGRKMSITRVRGQWFDGPHGSKMLPIFHPSYRLRNDSREKGSPKWLMWQDIREVNRVYAALQ